MEGQGTADKLQTHRSLGERRRRRKKTTERDGQEVVKKKAVAEREGERSKQEAGMLARVAMEMTERKERPGD